MIKKAFKVITSVMLVLTICITTCTTAFAASSRVAYISDLVLCAANSADEAETKLTKQGYKLMFEDNLNESLSGSGMYLGYKSTPNKSEAITDVAVMNMNGKYSFSDYEVLLDKMKEKVTETINGLIPMITAFRTNYQAGTGMAITAYELLNKFYEEDSGMGMGDYLLDCDLEDTADIVKVFMQGNSAFIVDIQQILFLAGGNTSDQKWIEQMAGSDEDYLIDIYMDSYPTPNKAYQALAADYGNSAEIIRKTWDNFYEDLNKVKEQYYTEENGELKLNFEQLEQDVETAGSQITELSENADDKTAAANLTQNMESQVVLQNAIDVALIEYLNSLEYCGGTMLDFFMRAGDDVDDTELYSLAYFMGGKLCAQVANVGLEQVVSRVIVDSDNADKSKFEDIINSLSEYDQISVYEGVDRTLFDDGVALTSATTKKYQSSGKNWSDDLFDRMFQPEKAGEYKWCDFFAFYVAPTLIFAAGTVGFFALATIMEKTLINSVTDRSIDLATECSKYAFIYNEVERYNEASSVGIKTASRFFFGKGSMLSTQTIGKIILGFRLCFLALTAIATVITAVMTFYTIFKENEAQIAKYSAIPTHIVDTVSTDNGDDYVAYTVVPSVSGSAGDLNNYISTVGWLSLYYTKDQSVGEPLTTKMKLVKGSSNAPLDYDSVKLFGEKTSFNLTSKDYTGFTDSAKGTYLYYNRGEATTTGSIFSNGNMAIAIGIGAVIGIALSSAIRNVNGKKKKESAVA